MDLLKIRWLRRLLRSVYFPIIPQIVLLVIFFIIVLGGWPVNPTDMTFAKIVRATNLANLIVWYYWWPLMVVAALLVGRLWCMVCPLELVTSTASRLGLKLRFPKVLKNGWLITGLYAVILIFGVHGLSIHRVPHRMAIYMLVLFGLALVVGLLFERRAFLCLCLSA